MTRRIKFKSRSTFNEFIHRITVTIGLGIDKKVSRVIYKNPIVGHGTIYWSSLVIKDDDDIKVIFDNQSSIQGYNHIELMVEMEKVGIESNDQFNNIDSQLMNDGGTMMNNDLCEPYGPINLDAGQHDMDLGDNVYDDQYSLEDLGVNNEYASLDDDDDDDDYDDHNDDDNESIGCNENVGQNEGSHVSNELIDLNVGDNEVREFIFPSSHYSTINLDAMEPTGLHE
ncbi:hypothetical protein GH714_035386 [Hevea brasiliensis]|uniref:Transposase MuDR plant domain-containing protein n=1 Tax=Hevea brasiliensis TaxID=3981 RepID=A0A6A6KDQ5_HEVBR|nr:hypothetical protein GH714_035386 [Hevea brasiliensis]